MNNRLKWAGTAMVIGGLLMFSRMVPIFAVLPDDLAFPPESTQEMVRLAGISGWRWQLSHVMGLIAVVLFAVAYVLQVKILVRLGWWRIGLLVTVVATVAFGLFGTALLIDGFVVPATIDGYLSTTGGQTTTLEHVERAHRLALRLFTPGVFLVFVAMGLLSSPMLHRVIHVRWLGIIGQAIAVSAVTAFLTGVAGPNWNNLQIAGTLMMAAFAWHLVVGSRAILSRSATEVS